MVSCFIARFMIWDKSKQRFLAYPQFLQGSLLGLKTWDNSAIKAVVKSAAKRYNALVSEGGNFAMGAAWACQRCSGCNKKKAGGCCFSCSGCCEI